MITKIHIEKFRGLENIELNIGDNLTAIAGQNGTLKSTLLGCLAQPFGIGGKKGEDNNITQLVENCKIVSNRFRGGFSNIFKMSEKFDIPGEHIYHVHFKENIDSSIFYENPIQVKSQKRPDDGIRIVTGKSRVAGRGNIEIPVVYLGLSRLFPIGELTSVSAETVELSDEEKVFFKESYERILILFGENYQENKNVKKDTFRTLAIDTDKYDWQSISAGQDNIGKIIGSILEFKRLKSVLKEKYLGGILLIDEIESTLFPKAQIRLIEFLNTQASKLNLQVIFTTHSLEVLNILVNDNRFKHHSTVNFMDKSTGIIRKKEIKNYDDIVNNLMVTTSNEKIAEPKINIYVEDDEAQNILKHSLDRKTQGYINIVSLKLGCCEIAHISTQLQELKNGIIVYDGDIEKEKTIRNIRKKMKEHQYSIKLPGDDSPEKEYLNFLNGLKADDSIWNHNKNYSMQFYSDRLRTLGNMNDRTNTKKWFVEDLKFFGRSGINLYKRWAETKKDDIIKFQADIKKLIKDKYFEIYEKTIEL